MRMRLGVLGLLLAMVVAACGTTVPAAQRQAAAGRGGELQGGASAPGLSGDQATPGGVAGDTVTSEAGAAGSVGVGSVGTGTGGGSTASPGGAAASTTSAQAGPG